MGRGYSGDHGECSTDRVCDCGDERGSEREVGGRGEGEEGRMT